jgi:uncharacterized protein YukE
MTGPRSTSPLASFAADWTGADIRRLHDLAATLYGYLPGITGVTTALNHEVAQLTGGDQGWRGPAASAFAAAWQRDAAAVEALAQVMAWTADITDDLAAELATIERTLEEAAQHGAPTYRLAYDQAMADARQASERAAVRLSDLYAVFTAGREPVVRQVVGGPAGSIEGVTAADVVQVGLGDQATAPADADAGHLWDGVL